MAVTEFLAESHIATSWQLSSTQMLRCTPEQQCHSPGILEGSLGGEHAKLRGMDRESMLSALESVCCSTRCEGISKPCFPIVQISRNMALFVFKCYINNPLGSIDSVLWGSIEYGRTKNPCLSSIWRKKVNL